MENFVVSARKYRPENFESVVGQSHITTTLQNAIKENHLAQAFLFCGPRGVGKTTCARILAKMVNQEGGKEDPKAGTSLNIYELDAASNNSVDDIRNLVDQVRYPPQYGKYKVYIIDEVHMLSNAAFNAFLKTLEEPPPYAIFILATTEKHKVIPTILSRCQIFDFNRIQVKDIADHLAKIAEQEKIKADPDALHLIAQKADGALRDALSMFDLIVTFSSDDSVTYKTTIENLHILDYDYYFKVTEDLYSENLPSTLLLFDKILREGFDGHDFIVGLTEHFRNLLVAKDTGTIQLLESSDEVKKRFQEQAERVDLSFLLTAMNIANNCDLQYKSSKNPRLHVELALMKMAHIPSAVNLASGQSAQEVKKKSDPVEKSNAPAEKKPEAPKPDEKTATGSGEKKGKKLKSTIRINDVKTPVPEEKKEVKPEVVTGTTEKNSEFTFEDLRKSWQEFAQKVKEEGRQNDFYVLDREISLQEDGMTIEVQLDNLIQLDQLNNFKHDILEYIRRSLNNNTIMIEAIIAAEEEQKIMYTSKDKYEYLCKKYPLLQEIKNQFGLENEF